MKRDDEQGQTMAEYAVVLSVITIVTLVAYQAIGDGAAALIQKIVNVL